MRVPRFFIAGFVLIALAGLSSEATAQCVICNVQQNCVTAEDGRTSCWWNGLGVCYEVGAYCGPGLGGIDAPQQIRLASNDQTVTAEVLELPLVWIVRNCRGEEVRRAYNAAGSAAMLAEYRTITFRSEEKESLKVTESSRS